MIFGCFKYIKFREGVACVAGGIVSVRDKGQGKFQIYHDASRLISIFSSRLKKCSSVSREIFNELNFKMELIQVKFQSALLLFSV